MKLIVFLTLWLSLFAHAADPTLRITAPVQSLTIGQTTTVTFTFSEPVTGFTVGDINVKGNASLSGFSGSGAVYTVSVQKLLERAPVSLVVDNNAASPAGHGGTIGFNVAPKIYIKDGNLFNGKLIEAVPQPRCPLPGEELVNASGVPTSKVVENYYTVVDSERRSLVPKLYSLDCLTRPISGQYFKPKASPKPFETINVHGAHNHATNMPKVNIPPRISTNGTTKTRVKPSNAEACTLNGSNVLVCSGFVFNGTASREGGEARFGNVVAKIDFDDPIVYPNQKGRAHAHTFFGNVNVDYASTTPSLLKCNSNFAGGRANCTGYWMPSIVDTSTNTAIFPDGILIYYKAGLGYGLTVPVPKGLKIIAGNPSATTAAEQTDDVRFECFPRGGSSAPYIDANTIPNCRGDLYSGFRITVNFPACVADDGFGNMVLDSANHRSHLGTNSDRIVIDDEVRCAPSFPHAISSISQIADHVLKPSDNTATWRLSSDNYSASLPGGASAHADWWGGWQDYWIERLVAQCNNQGFNCGVNYIGLNDGVGVSNITTSGNIATITTSVPHLLKTSNGDGTYPDNVGTSAIQVLLGKLSGVTGASAASYNFDPAKGSSLHTVNGSVVLVPHGTQRMKIINATQIEITLNDTPGTPINGATDPNVVKIQWGENLRGIDEAGGAPQSYSDFYYGNKD